MVYLKMHVENVYIRCSIEHLKRLEEQRSLSAKIYTRDERLIFRNYVLALSRNGTFRQNYPAPTEDYHKNVYEKSKVYRLAMVIYDSTRLIAENYERVWAGHAIEDCLHKYHHLSRIQCFLLALKFKQSFTDEYSYLGC